MFGTIQLFDSKEIVQLLIVLKWYILLSQAVIYIIWQMHIVLEREPEREPYHSLVI